MRRRWKIIAVVVLACLGGFGAWKVTHRHDARLVGRWLRTPGSPPTDAGLRLLRENNWPGDRVEWTFESDGTGRQYSERWGAGGKQYGFTAFRWWTDGGSVCVEWGDPDYGWASLKHVLAELLRVLHGESTEGRREKYTYVVTDETNARPRQFVLQSQNAWHASPNDEFYLTLIRRE